MIIKPRIKICCIANIEEAKMAIAYGASAIGLVGKMPSGPGVIDDQLIYEIAKAVPPPIATFLLTSETTTEKIIQHHRLTQTNTIQLVDRLTCGTYQHLREALPSIKLIQVIHVVDESSIDLAIELSGSVDAILLDSGNPNLKIKVLGGTGRIHNWKISRQIRDSIKTPIFLAGGLNSENVRQAIEEVEPFGLDLCGSVRTNGMLDEQKLAEFMKIALSY